MMKNTTTPMSSTRMNVSIAIPSIAGGGDHHSEAEQQQQQEQRRQMFDLSLIQEEKQWTMSSCSPAIARPYGSSSGSGVLSYSPPPMETLSVYSTTDDDNTSVSSVSTQGSVTRRSVFSQYWKKTGQEPPTFLARSSTPATPSVQAPTNTSSSSSDNDDVGPTEAAAEVDTPRTSGSAKALQLSTPPEHEEEGLESEVPVMTSDAADAVTVVVSPSRRSMFSSPTRSSMMMRIRPSSSAPSLSSVASDYDDYSSPSSSPSSSSMGNKSRSLSMLTKQPSASCLRESPRYSCTPTKNSSSSENDVGTTTGGGGLRRISSCISDTSSVGSSVRFDMDNVAVRHFEIPQERYAEEGWTNYFA